MAWLLVGLGVAQIGLIVAAFSRVIDPGPPAFNAIGTLAGLGTAVACGVVGAVSRARLPRLVGIATAAAVLAGLVYAGTWLSLLDATFLLDDAPRIIAVVASDSVLAAWFLLAAWTLVRPRPRDLAGMGILLMLRAAVEARVAIALLLPTGEPGLGRPGFTAILIGVLVLSGFVLLASWEISLSRWMLGRPRVTAG